VGKRYCVNGKCLEFGDDDLPLEKIHISLGQMRTRRRRSLPFNDIFNLTEINSTVNLNETLLGECVGECKYLL